MDHNIYDTRNRVMQAVNAMSKDELDRLLLHIETVKYVHSDKYEEEPCLK